MKPQTILLSAFLALTTALPAQPATHEPAQPKLVVGLMVDQMRWDYLYRYYDRYAADGGFKRLLGGGFSCENTMIPYAQTVTAAGHTCVYTGSVPAINGIMGNDWYDKELGRDVYCTEDAQVKTIGGAVNAEPMSPRNLWTTTICDELRLATNFRSKVIGIAIKDRGGILPAGHSANAAYWYDAVSGNWVTSTYYMNTLPAWVTGFNQKKWADSLYANDWNTLYPVASYLQSDQDNVPYEGRFSYEKAPVFPHELRSRIGRDYGMIRATPFGNTLTLMFAEQALLSEELGKDNFADFLAISLSSPDYIGHQFGPNSIEEEDNYLRMDKDLGSFLDFLDSSVGKGQYLFFITADHGVAHTPGFGQAHKIPGSAVSLPDVQRAVEEKFRIRDVVKAAANYQLYLDDAAISRSKTGKEEVTQFIVDYLNKQPDILLAFANTEINDVNLPQEVREMFVNGFNNKRGGDIQVVFKAGDIVGGNIGTSHGTWYPYDSHIPLVWYGWHVRPGQLHERVYMTDIAPTIAAMLHIQMPNGCIGKPIIALFP